MNLIQSQTQRQIISPAIEQSLHILQLPALELQSYLQEQILDNPLVELPEAACCIPVAVMPDADEPQSDGWSDVPVKKCSAPEDLTEAFSVPQSGVTLKEHLIEQLHQSTACSAEEAALCGFLIENLDSRGYLDGSLQELAMLVGASLPQMERALKLLQSLSPAGVGARCAEECLLLQLTRQENIPSYVRAIAMDYLPLLAKGNLRAIASALKITQQQAMQAAACIRSLNPVPGNGFADASQTRYVVPEAAIVQKDRALCVRMNQSAAPRLRLNRNYIDLMQNADAQTRKYLERNMQRADKLQTDLKKREQTLTRLMQCVAERQAAYLLGQAPAPQPMTICQAAELLQLHPSTVSRAVKDKYVVLPRGNTVPLKALFAAPGLSPQMTKQSISARILQLIHAEDALCPLSDEALRRALELQNIHLSRRTVAAYRSDLQIPTAANRRRVSS